MLTEKTYILCILKVFEKYSDSEHILTMKEILSKLKTLYDISVDRRTVYRNVELLKEFGYDISTFEDNRIGYYLREREFEPAELHMLGDAILTAEFIPENQGKALISKLKTLGSCHQCKPLGRLYSVKTNKKAPNREIFLTVELLDEAIRGKMQVTFDYTTYDLDLSQKPRRKHKYVVNPYVLYWSNGQYYLISNLEPHDGICHFRLDRIKNITVQNTPAKELDRSFDLYDYARNSLFMYGGKLESFTIRCKRTILNDVVDQFGDRIIITASDEDTFTTVVKATTGGMRLWAIHYFENCFVIQPQWLAGDVAAAIRRGMENYEIKCTD